MMRPINNRLFVAGPSEECEPYGRNENCLATLAVAVYAFRDEPMRLQQALQVTGAGREGREGKETMYCRGSMMGETGSAGDLKRCMQKKV